MQLTFGYDTGSWSSAGGSGTSTVQFGTAASGGTKWRSQLAFDYETWMNDSANYRVVGVELTLRRPDSEAGQGADNTATLLATTNQSSYSGLGTGTNFGEVTQSESGDPATIFHWLQTPSGSGGPTQGDGGPLLHELQRWFDDDISGMRLAVLGDEQTTGSLHSYSRSSPTSPSLTLTLAAPPAPTTLSAPSASSSVIATTTPTLVANPVSNPTEDVYYRFEIGTSPTAGSGVLATSGWLLEPASGPIEWVVPDNALRDGATYYARVYSNYLNLAQVDAEPHPPDPGGDRSIRVDLHVGSGGGAPTETAGSVPGVTATPSDGAPSPATPGAAATVNLVNGNLALGVPTHSVSAVGGPIAPSLVFNSRATPNTGLVGRYHSDDDASGDFTSGDELRGQRVDAALEFDWWGFAPRPVGGMPSGPFLVRWTGYVQPPTTGAWKLGVSLSGGSGARVFVGSGATLIVDEWDSVAPATVFATNALSAGTKVPITVEYHTTQALGGEVQLLAQESSNGSVIGVPPSWLSQSAPSLPNGWQLDAGGGGVTWVGLQDLGDVVVLRGVDGSSVGFLRTSDGGYVAPPGSEDHLTLDVEGRFTLHTASGAIYSFTVDGQLDAVVHAADDLHPAGFTYEYNSDGRLVRIIDPVGEGDLSEAQRSVAFTYATASSNPCNSAQQTPVGMLCEIAFWDDTSSELWYDTDGRLVTVKNPGYQDGGERLTIYSFGYDTAGRVVKLRDPLHNDYISYGCSSSATDDKLTTELTYDTAGRVTTVTKPGNPSAARPRPPTATTRVPALPKSTSPASHRRRGSHARSPTTKPAASPATSPPTI